MKATAELSGNPEERMVFVGPLIDDAAVERSKAARDAKPRSNLRGERIRTSLRQRPVVQPTIVADLPTIA
jgi:acyl-CoA reductase-like NAD-dependent aldehyde dehydrogenase